jgi:hypothetical protein
MSNQFGTFCIYNTYEIRQSYSCASITRAETGGFHYFN